MYNSAASLTICHRLLLCLRLLLLKAAVLGVCPWLEAGEHTLAALKLL